MASVNRVILIGNLGADPEIRYMPSGDAIANLRIATTETWKDKGGEKQEQTEWHRVVFFGRQAEVCGEYLKKGSSIYVEGSLRTRKWTDKEGQERYTTEIRGDRMQMLGGRGGTGNNFEVVSHDNPPAAAPKQSEGQGGAQSKPAAGSGFDDFDNDIPF